MATSPGKIWTIWAQCLGCPWHIWHYIGLCHPLDSTDTNNLTLSPTEKEDYFDL